MKIERRIQVLYFCGCALVASVLEAGLLQSSTMLHFGNLFLIVLAFNVTALGMGVYIASSPTELMALSGGYPTRSSKKSVRLFDVDGTIVKITTKDGKAVGHVVSTNAPYPPAKALVNGTEINSSELTHDQKR